MASRHALSLAQLEPEIRRRFSAAEADGAVYKEVLTVGSDRDVLTFFLEWMGEHNQWQAVTIDVDHVQGRITCSTDVSGSADLGEAVLEWVDRLLVRHRPGTRWGRGVPGNGVERCGQE